MQFFPTIDFRDPGPYLLDTIKTLEAAYHLRLTIHDHRGLLFDRDGLPFLPDRNYHAQEFCSRGRHSVRDWNRRCMEECAVRAELAALQRLQPFVHHCWKGGSELIVPIERNCELILILYAGIFRTKQNEFPDSLPDDLRTVWNSLPCFPKSRLTQLSRILLMIGQGILSTVEQYRKADTAIPGRKPMIQKFIDDHAHEPVRLEDLARTLYVSPSRAGHLVTEHFGMSFQMLVLKERMTRARNLLLSSSFSMKEIASKIGLKNEFYFSRMFRKFYGIPPGRFRKNRESPRQ